MSCWISYIGAGLCDILGDYTTRANHDIVADADGHDGGIRADAYPISDDCLLPLCLVTSGRSASAECVVDELGTVRDEAVLSDCHELADEGVALHSRARADAHSLLDLDERADEYAISKSAAIEIDGFDHGDVVTELDVDDARLQPFRLSHEAGAGDIHTSSRRIGANGCYDPPYLVISKVWMNRDGDDVSADRFGDR